MINLLHESVRAAVKQTLEEQNKMDWSDTVFREHPKYYGDVNFSNESVIIGDNGLVSSKKYLSFRASPTEIGILSTDFTTNISEKLASGRKAEYGSKVYTTDSFDKININNIINVLQFSPYNDHNLFCGDNTGTLSIFDIHNSDQKCIQTIPNLSSCINCMASHPSTGDILAIGGHGNISLIDLQQNKPLISTQIMDGEDDIINMTYSLNGNYLQCITQNQYLFIYDPRSDTDIDNVIKLRYTPTDIVCVHDTEIAVCGLTNYLEPIIYAYDVKNALNSDAIEDNYIFKQNYKHKQCKPMMKYDIITQLLYLSFTSCADVLALNVGNNFGKEALYHSVTDTFMAFDILPKHSCKKREINKMIKFGKDRIQLIVHTRGGRLIYDKLAKTAKQSMLSAEEYFTENQNVGYEYKSKCVADDFEEEKKRSISLYLHITGKEALSNCDKYFDLKISQTINCNLGLNLKTNMKYAVFPSPTYGGGALGMISLTKTGRKKQSQISAHAEKITTFDIGRNEYNEHFVITGAGDCKAIIHKISADNMSIVKKLYTLQCTGKVTFVGFHPRICDVCVIAANKEHGNDESNIYFYNYNTGKNILEIKLENTKNICDIQFESVIGLIAAVSSTGGNIKLMNIKTGEILQEFKCNTFMRDTKLFWASNKGQDKVKWYNKLICLGFGKSSVRKFSLYDVSPVVDEFYNDYNIIVNEEKESGGDNKQQEVDEEVDVDEKNEDEEKELKPLCSQSFGVSNAIPIGYYDGNDNLFYISSIGDRKIRIYEFNKKGISEMNASHQSPGDIQGMDFGLKQFVNVKKVELSKCYKLTKDGVISPISFYVPRKRMKYFQDDLYSDVLDVYHEKMLLDMDGCDDGMDLRYVSLRPGDMGVLSEAPQEELTQHQKRRNSQIALMEAAKLKEQPQSTEQAFDQFSRMVADAPTANRWDAQNIGTEVAEDEWSD